ncbi:MAG: hypothetical protein ACI87E_000237 [Mariniblastus sp.]|jgi:hypothetical protein
MSSQFVDINADGHQDILTGSFSGTPQIVMGGEDGYAPAAPILDGEGEIVLIAAFWNDEDDQWDDTDRCESKGHCTSSAAVDWDADGDLDLILGDYYGGKLFLRLNEGTAQEPKFASTNVAIEAGGKPMIIEKGLAAPVVIDWNQDGKFDLLCGGSKGGIYYYQNTGKASAPEFAAAKSLLEPVDKAGSFIGKVPSFKNQPTQPGSSLHIEPFDYDGDGDLDLLVGGRSSWLAGDVVELTDEEKERLKELRASQSEISQEMSALLTEVDADERKELMKSDEFKALSKRNSTIYQELAPLMKKSDPSKSGDFVWLLRRK